MTAAGIIPSTSGKFQKVYSSQIDSDNNLIDNSNPLPTKTISSSSDLTVTNSIDQTAFDLQAAAFSETTNISNDYIFDSIVLNFSTAEAKTITITGTDGTILWGGSVDTSSQNLGYNTTKQNFNLIFDQAFNGGDNITVAVTQFSSAGTMDCIVKIKQGGAGLVGNPVLGAGTNDIGKVHVTNGAGADWDIDVSGSGSVIKHEHRKIHEGKHYFIRDFETEALDDTIEWIVTVPAGTTPHLKFEIVGTDVIEVVVYEGTTGVVGGTTATPINNNRNSSNTSAMTIVKDPTSISNDGSRIWGASVGANKTVGAILAQEELPLKYSTSYLFRITSKGNGNIISYYGKWYEQ